MKALDRFIKGDMHGIHYAVSIFFATAILWFLVHKMAEANPVWAISSMVATSDPADEAGDADFARANHQHAASAAWLDWCSSPSAE